MYYLDEYTYFYEDMYAFIVICTHRCSIFLEGGVYAYEIRGYILSLVAFIVDLKRGRHAVP